VVFVSKVLFNVLIHGWDQGFCVFCLSKVKLIFFSE